MGPSIFSLVIADLSCLNSSTCFVKYADDVSLSIPIFYSTNCVVDGIDNIKNWSLYVGLNLNTSKCKYMFIKCHKSCTPITIPDFEFAIPLGFLVCILVKILNGIYTFPCFLLLQIVERMHLEYLKNLTYLQLNSLLCMNLLFCPSLIIVPLYSNGLNQKNCNILKSIQRKFHNIVCFHNCHCSIFPDVSARRISFSVKLFNQAHTDTSHLLHCIIPNKRTHFLQPYSKTDIRKRSFIPF